jgi:hypothetical protein
MSLVPRGTIGIAHRNDRSELPRWYDGLVEAMPMVPQSDLIRRATECVRLMKLAADPRKKESFRLLGEMWIKLAEESPNLPSDVIAEDVSAMETILRVLGDSEKGSSY